MCIRDRDVAERPKCFVVSSVGRELSNDTFSEEDVSFFSVNKIVAVVTKANPISAHCSVSLILFRGLFIIYS